MIRCPDCNGVNTRGIQDSFQCDYCFNAWFPDDEAKKLYEEWAELDKDNRLVAQMMGPEGTYQVQVIDWAKVHRRDEVAKELKTKHQSNIDLPPNVWYLIFQDALI